VDAGKTTLSEALLFQSGVIRKRGRVDHKDAFLDTDPLERERGITIFSKQAILPLSQITVTLLDTPGHVDFSAETERTLQVLDAAILVISGADGVQSHTETLWQLLQQYQIPVFLFINKMDLATDSAESVLAQLQQKLSPNCLSFSTLDDAFYEAAALANDTALQEYLEQGTIATETLRTAIAQRQLFPCCFGSALKQEGVAPFLACLETYAPYLAPNDDFGAKIYKITVDENGNRLSHLKMTGGRLSVRDKLQNGEKNHADSPLSRGKISAGRNSRNWDDLRRDRLNRNLRRRRLRQRSRYRNATINAGALLSGHHTGIAGCAQGARQPAKTGTGRPTIAGALE
jgi:small GTP-binding protein